MSVFRDQEETIVPVYLSLTALMMEETFGVCVVSTDLTDHKRTEEMIAAEKLSRAILEQAAEAIVVCDVHTRIIRANHAAHRLCGENPILRPFAVAFPLRPPTGEGGEGREGQGFSLSAVLDGQIFQGVEATLHRSDGETFHLLLTAGPLLSARNTIVGGVITLIDITARKQAETALW